MIGSVGSSAPPISAGRQYDYADKLKRMFTVGASGNPPDLDGPAYLQDTRNTREMIEVTPLAGSALVGPALNDLARVAPASGEVPTYRVPAERKIPLVNFAFNPHYASLTIITEPIITERLKAAVEGAFDTVGVRLELRPRNAPDLAGKGYRFELVVPHGSPVASGDLYRLCHAFTKRYVRHLTCAAIRWRQLDTADTFHFAGASLA